MDQQLPKELKLEEKVVSGEVAKVAWKEAFQRLGQVNEEDANLDDQFIKDCKEQISSWLKRQKEVIKDCKEQISSWLKRQKEANGELDKPIERTEVQRA